MRTPSYDALELELQIGPRGGIQVNSDNRALVQNWLVAQGVPSHVVKRMRVKTLGKAYNFPRYLDAILRDPGKFDTDYQPGAEPDTQPAPQPAPIPANPTPIHYTPIPAQPETKEAPAMEQPENAALEKLREALELLTPKNAPALDEARIIELIALHAPKPLQIEIKLLPRDEAPRDLPNDELRHKAFPEILRDVTCGNVFLRGPAGSGKTTVAEQVAKALELPFYFTGAVASEYKLLGFIDAKGQLVRTAFREAYEHGGLFLFDEIDASAPQALMAFNAALANGHMDFPDGVIRRHEKFHCIAAGNTFGQGADRVYVGRNQLDGATLDRFIFIDFDYDENLERALAGNDKWVDRVQAVRRAVEKLKLRHVVSPRASIMGAKMLAAGAAWPDVEARLLWRGLDADTRGKILAAC